MEQQLAPAELLRFLQAEAETMQQLQSRISNELHLLQVEEDVYVRTLERLKQKAASNQSTNGEETGGQAAGVELLEALHLELAPTVPPVSMVPPVSILPPDSALPTTTQLAITAAEANGVEDANVDSQLGAALEPVGDDYEEYELLDTLESEDDS